MKTNGETGEIVGGQGCSFQESFCIWYLDTNLGNMRGMNIFVQETVRDLSVSSPDSDSSIHTKMPQLRNYFSSQEEHFKL